MFLDLAPAEFPTFRLCLLDRVPCAKLTAFSQPRENRQMFHGLGSVGYKKNQNGQFIVRQFHYVRKFDTFESRLTFLELLLMIIDHLISEHK